jgi:hypothetical protein
MGEGGRDRALFQAMDNHRRPTYPKAAALHHPLRRVAICLDCEACFELGADRCPACGSETWAPLARFLDGRAASHVA